MENALHDLLDAGYAVHISLRSEWYTVAVGNVTTDSRYPDMAMRMARDAVLFDDNRD